MSNEETLARAVLDIQILKNDLGLLSRIFEQFAEALDDPIRRHYRREILKLWRGWKIHPVKVERYSFTRSDILSKLKPNGFPLRKIAAVDDVIYEGILVKVRGGRLKWGPEDLVLWALEEEGRGRKEAL